jgi:spermidine synthase
LIPSAIMGGAYPALCRVMIHSSVDVENRLGWIYGLNTVGAAAGALVAGFLLIETVGSTGAVVVANGINLAIGAGSLVLARRLSGGSYAQRAARGDDVLHSDLPKWVTGFVLFASGFATLGYEIVWFRALHYLLGPGTYTLSTLLTIFLLGLGFGSFLYRPALRWGRPEWNLGFSQLGVAVLAALAIGAEHYILIHPALSAQLNVFSSELIAQSWQSRLFIASVVAFALLLPATLWMGLTFPLASRLFLGSVEHLTARVGLAYLLSNLGSITGAVLAAVWILPSLGTIGGTKFLVTLNVGLGLLVLLRAPRRKVRLAAVAVTFSIIALTSALPARFAFGPMELLKHPEIRLTFEEESDRGTVQVFNFPGKPDTQAMAIDGAIIANTESWGPGLFAKQVFLAHLPMTLDRGIRHTLNLGIASGSTLAALARYPWIEILDGVEINAAVVRGGARFLDFRVFEDPRARLVLEDAMHYLLSTEQTYDLIVNDAKEHIRFGGNSKVLSAEFYQYSLDRLSECGMFVQEIPLINDAGAFGLILRTFRFVFPVMEIFLLPPGEAIMVGSRCPVGGRERPTEDELERAAVSSQIHDYFAKDATDLGALWVASGPEMDAAVGEGPINSWNKSPLEFHSYRQPLDMVGNWASNLALLLGPRLTDPRGASAFSRSANYDSMYKTNLAALRFMQGDTERARRLLREVLEEEPEHVLARRTIEFYGRMGGRGFGLDELGREEQDGLDRSPIPALPGVPGIQEIPTTRVVPLTPRASDPP